jgi:hypothetical protein
MQGMKARKHLCALLTGPLTAGQINDIEWLAPPGLGNQKTSQSDTRKRTEIFYEFLYYLFDSFLIPLIRSNFYVTESNVDRYRLFFFRHDVWRYVAEPAMAVLKTIMFEEVKTEDALRILRSRRLGYSQVRLLPKQNKMRPIMNLRRRTLLQGDKKVLGPSINTILGPVNSMLKLEKVSSAIVLSKTNPKLKSPVSEPEPPRILTVLRRRHLSTHQSLQSQAQLRETQVLLCQSRRPSSLRHNPPKRHD